MYKKVMFFVLGAGMLSGCAGRRTVVRYIVSARENNAVTFVALDAPITEHVMTFDSRADFYYENIRPGDTICCARRFPDARKTVRPNDANIRQIRTLDFYRAYEQIQQSKTK